MQSRRATSMGHKAIWCELWLCLPSDDGSKGGPVADAVPCSDISQKLIAQDYILDGVAFSKLWSDVLVYCSSVKIDVLYKRLMLTSCVSHATNLVSTVFNLRLDYAIDSFISTLNYGLGIATSS